MSLDITGTDPESRLLLESRQKPSLLFLAVEMSKSGGFSLPMGSAIFSLQCLETSNLRRFEQQKLTYLGIWKIFVIAKRFNMGSSGAIAEVISCQEASSLLPFETYEENAVNIGTQQKSADMARFIDTVRDDGLYLLDVNMTDSRISTAIFTQ